MLLCSPARSADRETSRIQPFAKMTNWRGLLFSWQPIFDGRIFRGTRATTRNFLGAMPTLPGCDFKRPDAVGDLARRRAEDRDATPSRKLRGTSPVKMPSFHRLRTTQADAPTAQHVGIVATLTEHQ